MGGQSQPPGCAEVGGCHAQPGTARTGHLPDPPDGRCPCRCENRPVTTLAEQLARLSRQGRARVGAAAPATRRPAPGCTGRGCPDCARSLLCVDPALSVLRPSPPHRDVWHPGLRHVPAPCHAGSRGCPFPTVRVSVVGLGNYIEVDIEVGTGARSDFPPMRKSSRPPRILVTTITVGVAPHDSARCRPGARPVPGSSPIPKGGTS